MLLFLHIVDSCLSPTVMIKAAVTEGDMCPVVMSADEAGRAL